MNDFGQRQLLTNAVCEHRGEQCCGNACKNDAAVCDAAISLRSCSCSRAKLAVFKNRQTSVASGDSGLSLDPINEHHDSGEVDVEDYCANSCSPRRHECTCAHDDDHPSDKSDLIRKSICERHPPNTTEKMVSGSRGSETYASGRSHILRNGRIRTRSESCLGDNIVVPANPSTVASYCTNCHPRQQFGETFDVMDVVREKKTYDSKEIRALRRRFWQLFCFTAFVFIISSTSLSIAIAGYGNNRSKFYDGDSKTEEFRGSLSQKQTASIPPGMLAGNNKPHIHLQLNGSRQMRVTRWRGKVLSWLPDISESDNLRYNRDTYTVTVSEAGSYFVYNQIYVARMINGQTQDKRDLSNQTVMHTVYRIPFNFPSSRKPVVVAESVLAHCWDEDATTQIHASYLGIIVNMRRNEQLLIALASFRESVDKLMPSNTFFGMFKL